MLRNKYVLVVVGFLLVNVVGFNINFFAKRSSNTPQPAPAVKQPASDWRSPENEAPSAPASDGPAGTWRRDPFWYGGVRSAVAAPKLPPARTASKGLSVEGSIFRDGKGYALINGQIAGVGESVNGYEVLEIRDRSITLKGPNGTRTINLYGE